MIMMAASGYDARHEPIEEDNYVSSDFAVA